MATLTEQFSRPSQELLQRLTAWQDWLSKNPDWHAMPKDVLASDADPLRDIKRFVHCLAVGVYPPADCLLNVAQRFASYLDGASLSLESAFNVRPVPRAGTPVAKERTDRARANVLWRMAELRVTEQVSVERAAEIACDELDITKPDALTFVRYYSDGERGKRFEAEYRSLLS